MPPKAASSGGSKAGGETIDLNSLPAQTLLQIKKQLDDELEHLNSSFNSLRAAMQKFADCLTSIQAGVTSLKVGATILVPLTNSLYVPGQLADNDRVLVDVGTGFYVEKSSADAKKFYEGKIKEIEANLRDLEEVLRGKSQNLRVVEDVLRQKVMQSQQQQGQQTATAAAGAA